MKDSFGRDVEYMRISVTDRCNLRCKYCMPEDLPDIPHPEILRYEEILRVCAAATRLGIRNFRVTGGEPLVRRGCVDFIRKLGELPGVGKLMLTTNGVSLERCVPELVEIGIDSVNISLDALDRENYRMITGYDVFADVYRGIMAALAAGLRVKLNCVAMRGVNEEQLLPIAKLAARHPLDVRFIESMPIGAGKGFDPVTGKEIVALLEKHFPGLEEDRERRGFGPAAYYMHKDLLGRIGVIDAVSHGFCESCNRIRLTSDGLLKTCLYYSETVDLKPILRRGGDDSALEMAIREAVAHKKEKHLFHEDRQEAEGRKMSQIGG
ncbi:MAG: GTP 3',8-cyclase MoaA [Clostridiales bacterium]|nr:GTP 3',8-cyclase MoaA [Clostridiales bacterium]